MKGRDSSLPSDFKKEENIVITYVKSKEAKLFELATEKLGASERLDIDQYLNRLSELYAISPRFVRLPLFEDGHEDEEIFEIDANARTITVPSSFAKNGVGVVSDELAETLWFKINRYFDLKDFGKAAGIVGDELRDGNLHILIEWEAPDGTKNASWAYAIDADTDPDWIYFGWALTSEHLTAKAGQIKFAVRIVQFDHEGISYSFATQVANITVKPTLEFDLTAEDLLLESVADKISNRIMGGQIAFCPVFVDIPAAEEGGEATPGDLPEYMASLEGGVETARLTVNAAAPEDETYDAMAYIWYKKGKDETEFSEVTDLDAGAYTPSLAVTSSGQYYVVVYGMKEITDNTIYTYDAEATPQVSAERQPFWYHTSVSSTKSTVCEIPMPIPLEIEQVPLEAIIMDPEATATVQVVLKGVQKIKDDVEVGLPGLRVEKTNNAALITEGEAEFTPVTLADGQVTWNRENLTLTFNTWTTTETPGEEEGDDPIISTANIDEAYYRFTVLNTLNGDTAETEQQFVCRITGPAKAPANLELKLMNASGTESSADHGSISDGDKLKAAHDDFVAKDSDGIVYAWFERVGQTIDDDDDLLIEGATEQVYIPNHSGAYYAKVTNKFNGTENTVVTEAIAFNA